MKNAKIGYAVVGLGIGMAHADAAYEYDRCELVAVCDINKERLEKAAEKYEGVKLYESFDELICDSEVDIISICLPSGMHAEFAVKALEAGKHVLVEKPVDITVEAAMKIDECARRTGLKAGVIHQNRNNALMKPIKEAVDAGRLGKMVLGTFAVKWYREQHYYDNGWHGTWGMDGGGSLMNQAVHTVDLMQWLMGEVESVTSKMGIYGHDIETEDMTASVITFKSGATATFVSTTCAYPGISTEICLYGTGGSIEADADVLKTWKLTDSWDIDEEEAEMLEKYGGGNHGAEMSDPMLVSGHKSMIIDMVDAVIDGRDPQISVSEAVKSVHIVNAVYESARSGKTVTF
ncbi:MAG: Gfo/Idh/MocA family oxidoreductase [Clostridia bacterium]|nr:Gfo/Idh/MocA family oxidoreductase [Clostridia bacterium]